MEAPSLTPIIRRVPRVIVPRRVPRRPIRVRIRVRVSTASYASANSNLNLSTKGPRHSRINILRSRVPPRITTRRIPIPRDVLPLIHPHVIHIHLRRELQQIKIGNLPARRHPEVKDDVHRFFGDQALGDLGRRVGSDGGHRDLPTLCTLAVPHDVPIIPRARVTPVLEPVRRVPTPIIIRVIHVRHPTHTLLQRSPLKRVEMRDGTIENRRRRTRVRELHLRVERCDLETLRDLALPEGGVDLRFEDV